MTLDTAPVISVDTGYFLRIPSHGLGNNCLMPSENFSFSLSIFSTTASISSPFLKISLGCLTCSVHEMSEM